MCRAVGDGGRVACPQRGDRTISFHPHQQQPDGLQGAELAELFSVVSCPSRKIGLSTRGVPSKSALA